MSLRSRLIISHTLIVVLCLGIVAVAVTAMLQGYRDRLALGRLDDMMSPITVQVRSLMKSQTPPNEIWATLEEQARNNDIYILLADADGNITRQATPQGQPAIQVPAGTLTRGTARTTQGTFLASGGRTFLYSAYPLGRLFSARLETLILSAPRTGTVALWLSLLRPFFWAGLIALGISIVVAYFLARSVYRPIQRITQATEAMAKGHYQQEIPVAGPQEIKGLAANFNQMARQVQLSEQRLRYFVADVSHQLKNPLTSIRGFAQAMLDGTAKDEPTRLKAAQVIEDESKRMLRQVNELLELSRMQSGQVKLAREPVDIKELLEHCREIFQMRAEEKSLTIKSKIEPPLSVLGDIDRLEQVFNNLLDNAIKNSPSAGEVTITARKASTSSVEVRVGDSGPGIPPDQLPHLFERFYQSSGTRSGTGLGLAIAREIVLAHGGKIEVSTSPGEGAEFIVTLPSIPPSA